jgi:SAM-dependent methyltransferase
MSETRGAATLDTVMDPANSHRGADHPCPLCGGPSRFAFAAEDRNRRIAGESFAYNRCSICSTVFMVDAPADLARYYSGGYHQFDDAGEPLWKGDPGLLAAEAWRVQTLRRFVEPGPLIDVGAGAGGFTAAARDGGFDVTAIEMDQDCCTYMSDALGVRAICTDEPLDALAALPPARVVTFWHVLEHLREPGTALAAAAAVLEPGGVLALGVPNPRSIQSRVLRGRWAHIDAPRHLCLMPAAAIAERARALGLEQVGETTSDPSGLACNLHGWVYALRRDPSDGLAAGAPLIGGRLITAALGPVERRGSRGAALTMFLRKPAA